VRHNAFTGGRRGLPAIQVGGTTPGSRRPTTDNVIARNAAVGNDGDGILVTALAERTTLERNLADRNGANGIHVLNALTAITRNTANGNAAFGIQAVAGVTRRRAQPRARQRARAVHRSRLRAERRGLTLPGRAPLESTAQLRRHRCRPSSITPPASTRRRR
jgi:hypothetical protein